ncbi:hypothetical protein [Ornithinimicrobium pratense]|uniref:Uncharacterized protein n=1 Tax=Ornithinimicrobium pratense TaxID=2593973 RepID=A0A5J6V130_9MICO|nr:hypothetical protein [Ornithinimicrobium pratense]QFG67359.1 hypothetical protein FY030_00235 [Ornithinimicrobium pratense]
MPAEPRITLLGPQREPHLQDVVRSLELEGCRFATITAGWREREGEDEVLDAELGGNTVNLRLWRLLQQLWEADPELEAADRQRRHVLGEMQELYVIGLQKAAEALREIHSLESRDERAVQMATDDVLAIMRDMDDRHRQRVAEVHLEFYATYEPEHRPAVTEARFLVGRRIADCDAVVIPGGHVGVLLGSLHIANLAPALAAPSPETAENPDPAPTLYRPIIAWGAGAMVLTERVLLFYDDSVVAPAVSEVLMDGLALTRGLVALPNATARLTVKDRARMAVLARRCAPRLPVLLDPGAQVTLTVGGEVPTGARIVDPDGKVVRHDREATG